MDVTERRANTESYEIEVPKLAVSATFEKSSPAYEKSFKGPETIEAEADKVSDLSLNYITKAPNIEIIPSKTLKNLNKLNKNATA